jgi:signal peptidase II
MIENITTIPVIGDFFKLHYVTNPGMAFGVELGGNYGKISLTVFRIFAMFGIAYYIRKIFIEKAHKAYQVCVALIFGGAIGNLLDSIFYAVLDYNLVVKFKDEYGNRTIDPPTPWFHGKVIDMFYVDIAHGYTPVDWPVFNGIYYSLWPVFNVADAAIFCSVIFILIKQKKIFPNAK